MKTLTILSIATFIIAQICISQDIIDPPKLFNKDTSAVITPTINSFIRSWNWGSPGRKLDEAMGEAVRCYKVYLLRVQVFHNFKGISSF